MILSMFLAMFWRDLSPATKGSSVELPSNFQFVTTKIAKYE